MTRSTTTRRVRARQAMVFITVHKLGPSWHSGWGWEVHDAIKLSTLRPGTTWVVGALHTRGRSAFRFIARLQARGAADRVQPF